MPFLILSHAEATDDAGLGGVKRAFIIVILSEHIIHTGEGLHEGDRVVCLLCSKELPAFTLFSLFSLCFLRDLGRANEKGKREDTGGDESSVAGYRLQVCASRHPHTHFDSDLAVVEVKLSLHCLPFTLALQQQEWMRHVEPGGRERHRECVLGMCVQTPGSTDAVCIPAIPELDPEYCPSPSFCRFVSFALFCRHANAKDTWQKLSSEHSRGLSRTDSGLCV